MEEIITADYGYCHSGRLFTRSWVLSNTTEHAQFCGQSFYWATRREYCQLYCYSHGSCLEVAFFQETLW